VAEFVRFMKRAKVDLDERRRQAVLLDEERLAHVVSVVNEAFGVKKEKLGGDWFHVFKKHDRDGGGHLDEKELKVVMRKELGIESAELADSDLHGLWAHMDKDSSGTLTLAEFTSFLNKHASGKEDLTKYTIRPDRLAHVCGVVNKVIAAFSGGFYALFKEVDKDGHGTIDLHELFQAMRKTLKITKKVCSDDDVKGLWGCMDADRSGDITLSEFSGFLRRYAKADMGGARAKKK